jgi:heme exporter protein D
MSWGSASNFFAMGGYAFYVWCSYGVTFSFLALEITFLLMRKRTVAQRLGRRIRMRIEVKNEAQT